jgi:hypothetical protein
MSVYNGASDLARRRAHGRIGWEAVGSLSLSAIRPSSAGELAHIVRSSRPRCIAGDENDRDLSSRLV